MAEEELIVTDLDIDTGVPRYALLVENILSKEESQDWIDRAERADNWEKASVNVGAGRQVLRTDIRNSERWIVDDPVLMKEVYDRIKHLIPDKWDSGGETYYRVRTK